MAIRNFQQRAIAFGPTPATVTVTLDGDTVYEGAVLTLDQPIPPLSDPEYLVDNVAWSWQQPGDFEGTRQLSISVSGASTLLLAQTQADNPWLANTGSDNQFRFFWSVKVDGTWYVDPLTEETIDGVAQSSPYRPEEPGQWWWQIPGGSVFTAVLHVAQPTRPFMVFDQIPGAISAGSSGQFEMSITTDRPIDFPQTYVWRVVNGTTTDDDFVAVSGNVVFETANAAFEIGTVSHAGPSVSKDFRVEIQNLEGNALISSRSVTIT